jgi:hypothetical protein
MLFIFVMMDRLAGLTRVAHGIWQIIHNAAEK